MALQEANVRRAEDVRAGVVQQALAHARRSGSDVRGASQARPTRTRATQPHAPVDGHACGAGRPSLGAGGPQRRGRAPGVIERRAVVSTE